MKVLSRLMLLVIIGFAVTINQFSAEKIESTLQNVPYRCPLKWFTGLECAFCGMTHSWIAALRGEWANSFQENLFGPLLLAVTIIVLVLLSMGKKINVNQKWGILTISILFVFTILRNIL